MKRKLKLLVNRKADYDPTGTTVLRDSFAREMRIRFEELRRVILHAVIVDDIFGIGEVRRAVANSDILISQSPGRRAYAFQTDSQKVESFIDWLNQETENNIFMRRDTGLKKKYTRFTTQTSRWTDTYIDSAYQKGIRDTHKNLIRQGIVTDKGDIDKLRGGAFTETFNTPIHIERVSVLFTRTFETLKGVTQVFSFCN